MSLQNRYSSSIHPRAISELKDERFDEFIQYFQRDCGIFAQSCSNPKGMTERYLRIKDELAVRNLFQAFSERISLHSRLSSYRINPINQYLGQMYDEYNTRNAEIYAAVCNAIRRKISLPPTTAELRSLNDHERKIVEEGNRILTSNYIRFIVGICGLINSMFFAFESECKISSSLSCFEFSILFAKGEIIQHSDVWRTLRKLGANDPALRLRCQICLMERDCKGFAINYEALANVYCYALKFRMLSDYAELFFSSAMWEKIKVYFDELNTVVASLVSVNSLCLEART